MCAASSRRAIRRRGPSGTWPVEYSSALSSGVSLPITSASVDGNRSTCGLRMRDSTAHSAATYAVCGATWRPPAASRRRSRYSASSCRTSRMNGTRISSIRPLKLWKSGISRNAARWMSLQLPMNTRSRNSVALVIDSARALDGGEQVLVVLERALEQIVELDDAAVRADDLAAVLVAARPTAATAAARVSVRSAVIWRSVASTESCGSTVTQPGAVAVRDLEPLDLDVAQHLDVVAVVAREQRVVDRAVLRRQRAAGAGSR